MVALPPHPVLVKYDGTSTGLNSHQRMGIGIISCLLVLCTCVVGLRLYIRCILLKAGSAGWDDLTVFIAWLMAVCMAIGSYFEVVAGGLGKHIEDVPPEQLHNFSLSLLVVIQFYNAGLNMVKLSFLAQFYRIFPSRRIRRLCVGLSVFTCVWMVVQAMLYAFSCVPTTGVFPKMAAVCIKTLPTWTAISAFNVVHDIFIFCIPLKPLWEMPLLKRQRYLLIAIFCVGFLVCVISIVRIPTLRQGASSPDATFTNMTTALWSLAELDTAILCTSLPILRPLVARFIHGVSPADAPPNQFGRAAEKKKPQPQPPPPRMKKHLPGESVLYNDTGLSGSTLKSHGASALRSRASNAEMDEAVAETPAAAQLPPPEKPVPRPPFVLFPAPREKLPEVPKISPPPPPPRGRPLYTPIVTPESADPTGVPPSSPYAAPRPSPGRPAYTPIITPTHESEDAAGRPPSSPYAAPRPSPARPAYTAIITPDSADPTGVPPSSPYAAPRPSPGRPAYTPIITPTHESEDAASRPPSSPPAPPTFRYAGAQPELTGTPARHAPPAPYGRPLSPPTEPPDPSLAQEQQDHHHHHDGPDPLAQLCTFCTPQAGLQRSLSLEQTGGRVYVSRSAQTHDAGARTPVAAVVGRGRVVEVERSNSRRWSSSVEPEADRAGAAQPRGGADLARERGWEPREVDAAAAYEEAEATPRGQLPTLRPGERRQNVGRRVMGTSWLRLSSDSGLFYLK